jgi:hypothetical protein
VSRNPLSQIWSHNPLRRFATTRLTVLVGGAVAIVAILAPMAIGSGEGKPLRGGARNPSSNSALSYFTETQIIANNSTYGTRQSNKGSGGGAIYGCRSTGAAPACVAATNLKDGRAFAFTSSGKVGGTITLSDKTAAPLTTNATGVATGFNANYLEGKQAKDFVPATQASSFAQTSQLLFAAVSQTGVLGANRGATAAAQAGEREYTVTFNTSLAKCALTASPVGAALTTGSLGVSVESANPDIANVTAPSALSQGFNLQVIC